ncbi:EAL domain-containing protein [Colwellia sp. 12G3]|uniref:EAL domain-containing protein n=1 Tax=Colwellia sp. 12G3 TaxID=2058299 RepID=UPI000C334174|nr:EAL domain-containing protein [Colwellia sp. 12G3]PKI16946.1 diguanylate cyclase [Colwellia sp. 12G3]
MFNKLACDLTIRARLKIFLLLPWFIVLCLGISHTIDYLHDIEQARQARVSITISSDIDKLIYELQKERGLSAGIIANASQQQLFQLQKQRKQTDFRVKLYVDFVQKIELTKLKFNSAASKYAINKILQEGLVSAKNLTIQRKKIDDYECNSYFVYYSQFIKQLLRLISQIQVQLKNTEQNRDSVDLLKLLYLQEKSGQERGALNALLNSEQLHISQLQQVIAYGNEQKKIIGDLFAVSKSHHQLWLQRQLNSDNNQKVLVIRALLNKKLIRAEQLARLERELGYGGLIHHFKNYILRGEASYLESFLKGLSITHNHIVAFNQISNLTDNDKQAIYTIEQTLNLYHQHIILARSSREKGINAEKIDEEVRIDDSQAIAAIKQLQRNELDINVEHWWNLSTQRIDSLREISNHIRSDIQRLAVYEEQKAIERLVLYLAIFILAFITTLYFSFSVVKRIIKKIKYISSAMTTMQLEHKFNQPLQVMGNDEITDMVIAFNQMLAERSKSEGEQKISAAVFKYASEAIMITNANNEIETVNPAFCHISGYEMEEVLGKSPNILNSGRHNRIFYQEMWQALERDNSWQGEIWNKRKNDEVYPEFLAISVVRDQDGKPLQYISLFSDITKHKKYEEDIWLQANYDSLTGLPNRDLCLDRLRNELDGINNNNIEITLLFIDLDRFKNVNDTWGHNSGDELLKLAAIRLRNCLREKDTVARFGGDEFVVLLVGLSNRFAVERVVKNILATLAMPFHLSDNNEAVVSASVGVTVAPNDGDSAELLLKNADTAMYQAKAAGRNTYQFFTKVMNETVSKRMYIEQALRQAIKLQEFVLHYQPVVSLDNGEIIGVEALIRWQHPNKGLIYPDSFIEIAEETGLIEPIGQWVIEQACADLRHWHSIGLKIQVAVNVSSRQCKQASKMPIKEILNNALKVNNIEPSCLKVEITESLLMDNSQEMITTLQEIRSLGVAIHMDDFGTGYSSLSYLKHFPIDVLKIDRSFIEGAIDDKTDASLVEAVVLIGHSLSLKLVGEGIETQQHYDYLRSLGCDYGQGYFISKPIVAAELIVFCQQAGSPPNWLA